MNIHPEAIEAVNKIYAAYQKGEDVRWVDTINEAVEKAKGLTDNKAAGSPMDRIFLTVCCYFNQKPSDVRGRSKKREHAWPRMLAQLLMKESGEKLAVIDRYFATSDSLDRRSASHNVVNVADYVKYGREKQDYLDLKTQLGL